MAKKEFSRKIQVNSVDKKTLKTLIYKSLENDGVPPEEIPKHSQAGILVQAIQTNFDTNLMAVLNLNRESSVLYCRNMSSLYSLLVQHTDEIELSRPSKIDIMIKIPLSYIDTYGTPLSGTSNEFVYTNDNEIKLDGLPFVCDYKNIYIRTYGDNEDFREVRAFILNDEGSEVNLNIQRYTDPQTGVVYAMIDAPFSQIEREFREYAFTDVQYERFVVETKRPIYDFTLTYISPGGKEKPIMPKLYQTRTTGDFLEYKFLQNNSIVIDHNYVFGGFLPELNGTLRVDLVTTYGKNIKYMDNAKISKLYPNNLIIEYLPIGEEFFKSYGGKLATDDKEAIRSLILKLKGTRKRIDTESDMKTFLSNYPGSSLFEPRVTVNNVKRRIFSAYTTLSFSEQISQNTTRTYTIPTDSDHVFVNPSKLPKYVDGLSKTYYSINSDVTIVSKQSDIESSYTINIGDESLHEGEYLYKFISPFIHTYCKDDNYIRTFLDQCDNTPYPVKPIYESSKLDVESRFVAANLRVNLIKEDNLKYKYEIRMQIRADNPKCDLMKDSKFKAKLLFPDPQDNEKIYEVKLKSIEATGDNNKYNLLFDCYIDREVYGDLVRFHYKDAKDEGQKQMMLHISTPLKVELYLKDRAPGGKTYLETFSKITTYECETFKFLEEVTRHTSIQSTISYEGDIKIIKLPMVEKTFYDDQHMNRLNIYKELKNLVKFINKEVYDELDVFAKHGNTIRDLQETLYDLAIKFVKSVGVSKRLQVGSDSKVSLMNLQLKPRFLIKRRSKEFDIREISNILNNIFITQDFLSSELCMWNVVSDILTNNSEFINSLQFLNFDHYNPDYHTISRKTFDTDDNETPEVLSLGFHYVSKFGIYDWDVSYKEI